MEESDGVFDDVFDQHASGIAVDQHFQDLTSAHRSHFGCLVSCSLWPPNDPDDMEGMSRLFTVMTLVSLMGCDSAENSRMDTDFVVECVLIAGWSTPSVRLSKVVDLAENYTFKGEPGAHVTMRVTGPQTDTVLHYDYVEAQYPGYYGTTTYNRTLPLHRYELTIQPVTPALPITASTVVPDTFSMIGDRYREIVHASGERLELRITPGFYSGREPSHYMFVTQAWEWEVENLVPHAREEYADGDGESLRQLALVDSPAFSFSNSDIHGDGTAVVQYPLDNINFYGGNRVCLYAIDENVYDFKRSTDVQQGGSTFAPGEIPNPLSHITGAHSLFGSATRDCIELRVLAS